MSAENDIVVRARKDAARYHPHATGLIRDLAAEIVRLRGEVCSCPSGDGSLRWPCKAHPPESIAPAEAKGDWQYESMRFLAYKLRQMSAVGFDADTCADAASWLEKFSRPPQPAEAKGDARQEIVRRAIAHMRDNPQPESGEFVFDEKLSAILRERTTHQPADGGAVAHGVVKAGVRDADGEFHIECRFADGQKFAAVIVDGDHENLAHAIADFLTRPPAAQVQQPVTEEWLRAEAKRRGWYTREGTSVPTADGDWRHPFDLTIPSRDMVELLATHPAGDALGAEDTELLRWLIANELIVHRLKDNGRWMIVTGDLSPATDGSEHDTPREAIRAALQHRGDSRGGEG